MGWAARRVPSLHWEGQWRLLSLVGYVGIEISFLWLNSGGNLDHALPLCIGCLNPSDVGIALSGVCRPA